MLEFIVAAVVIIGVLGLFRAKRRCHARGWDGRRGSWDGRRSSRRGRGRGRGGFGRAAGEVLKRRLDIDEDQEGIVDHALADLRAALKELGETVKDSRTELADAFRGESVDDSALAAVFARHDDALSQARRDVVSALKQVHAVLDDDQRRDAASWLGSAKPTWI